MFNAWIHAPLLFTDDVINDICNARVNSTWSRLLANELLRGLL